VGGRGQGWRQHVALLVRRGVVATAQGGGGVRGVRVRNALICGGGNTSQCTVRPSKGGTIFASTHKLRPRAKETPNGWKRRNRRRRRRVGKIFPARVK
jgi:hypothetical protein